MLPLLAVMAQKGDLRCWLKCLVARIVAQAAASRRGKQVAFYCGEALGGGRP